MIGGWGHDCRQTDDGRFGPVCFVSHGFASGTTEYVEQQNVGVIPTRTKRKNVGGQLKDGSDTAKPSSEADCSGGLFIKTTQQPRASNLQAS